MFWFGKKNKKERFINSVRIGNQVWMTENLNVDHYRNGDPIPDVRDPQEWTELTTGAWCYFNNNPANGAIYGKLYNWYAVNDPRGLAPQGWHIPSDAEWQMLVDHLGGSAVAGGKLKEQGTKHWDSPNTGASNESGFSALPGGHRDFLDGNYIDMGTVPFFWSSTENNSFDAFVRFLHYDHPVVSHYYFNVHQGASVRCVRD